jgi:hypothetical protein
VIVPGRNATRNFSRVVSRISAAVEIHDSSHHVPVGVSTASKPSCSAVRGTPSPRRSSAASTPTSSSDAAASEDA